MVLSDATIQTRFHKSASLIQEEILPLMEAYGVVQTKKWRGSGNQRAWSLKRPVEEVLRAEADPAHELFGFWSAVAAAD